MLGCTMSSQPELSDILRSFSYCLLQKRRQSLKLVMFHAWHTRAHFLPQTFPSLAERPLLAWAPLWPCAESYMCWLIPCVSGDVSHCQGWLIWAGWKKAFPGNRHIPQTALECFYRRPRDLQRQVWLSLCKLPSFSPDIVYRFFFLFYEL